MNPALTPKKMVPLELDSGPGTSLDFEFNNGGFKEGRNPTRMDKTFEEEEEKDDDADEKCNNIDGGETSGCFKRNRRVVWCSITIMGALFFGVGAVIVMAMVGGGGDDDGNNGVLGAGFGIFGGGNSGGKDDDGGTPALAPASSGGISAVPAPTATPTSSPPTLAPTTTDTASVDIQFVITATAPPTAEDEVALKTTVAETVGVPEDNIEAFTVTSTTVRRRLGDNDASPPHDARQLAAVTWDVSFRVRTSLSEVRRPPAGRAEFESRLQSTLSNSTFVNKVNSAVPTATVDPGSVATRLRSRSPTSLPTPPPTLQITYPSSSSPIVLGAGLARLALSGENDMFHLSRVSPLSGAVVALAGRSYNGHLWEPVPGLNFEFDCDWLACVVAIPDDGEGKYQLTMYTGFVVSENRSLASRFLTQATFGPTRSSIKSFLGENGGNFGAWIASQVEVAPTLHRAYWRRRTNPRLLVSTSVGSPRGQCDTGSRWHRFSISHQDRGKAIEVADIAGTDQVTLTIDGVLRTVVPKSSFNTSSKGLQGLAPYAICEDVQEVVGGAVAIGTGCAGSILNPALVFTAEALMPEGRLGVQAATEDSFTPVKRIVDTGLRSDISDKPVVGDVFVLASNVSASELLCSDASLSGVMFATTPSGTVLLHDSRLQFLENTIENPIINPAANGECPSVPKTFLNADSCVPNRQACSTVSFTSSLITLNDTVIKKFYELGGHYVHAVVGLQMYDVPSPCSSLNSRWIKKSAEARSTCSTPAVDSASQGILLVALEAKLAASTSVAPSVLDISLESACTAGAEAVGAKLYLNNSGGCWQHVHDDELSVFDFSFWTVAHDGNPTAILEGRRNPIMAFALSGSATFTFPALSSLNPHPMSRWETGKASLTYLGNFNDEIDFSTLPASSQSSAMAQHVGSVGAYASVGFEACGSPGEVANDPALGHRYYSYLSDGLNQPSYNQRDTLDGTDHAGTIGKEVVWTNIAVTAPDQLRQRVAWALAQIFVVSESGASKQTENEPWHIYNDIFVRNAFGNYRTVMKEISYNFMMSKMLTFLSSQSLEKSSSYPDEVRVLLPRR
jgi:cullin-associated NEDD8-dissociated protein 1